MKTIRHYDLEKLLADGGREPSDEPGCIAGVVIGVLISIPLWLLIWWAA